MTWIKTLSLLLHQKGEKPGFRDKDTKHHVSMGENWLYREWWCKAPYVNGDNFTEDEDSKHYMSMGTTLQRMKIQNTICQWGQFYREWWCKAPYVNGDNFTEDEDSKHYMSMGTTLQRMKIQNTICQWGKTAFSDNDDAKNHMSMVRKQVSDRRLMHSTRYQWGKNWLSKEWWCKAPYIKWGKITSETMVLQSTIKLCENCHIWHGQKQLQNPLFWSAKSLRKPTTHTLCVQSNPKKKEIFDNTQSYK